MSKIAKVEYHPIRIPYPRPMTWASISEDAASYGLLRLVTEDGITGVAEGTVKTTWTSSTLRSLGVVIEEIFEPILIGLDVTDEAAVSKLWRFREVTLAKAMIDVAIWDIRSQIEGEPLWKMWGGTPEPEVSWVVTRQAPKEMAKEAEDIVTKYGIGTLKVKGGQGIPTDMEAMGEIRRAVGNDVQIYVDPNKDYSAGETPGYLAQLANFGVMMVEDPCPLYPDDEFTRLQKNCVLPILVDNTCRDIVTTKIFVERGAKAFNLKLQKARGYTENREIIDYAHGRGADVNIGLFGESSLGSLAALQLASALPKGKHNLPAEVTLFLMLPDEYVREPLKVADGRVRLPDTPGMEAIVDWQRVAALAP